MSHPHLQESAPAHSPLKVQRHSGWLSRRPWYPLTVTLLTLAILILGFFLLKRRLFPHYWTIEDLGPIATNPGKAPTPRP
jgi:hypothetical protein